MKKRKSESYIWNRLQKWGRFLIFFMASFLSHTVFMTKQNNYNKPQNKCRHIKTFSKITHSHIPKARKFSDVKELDNRNIAPLTKPTCVSMPIYRTRGQTNKQTSSAFPCFGLSCLDIAREPAIPELPGDTASSMEHPTFPATCH